VDRDNPSNESEESENDPMHHAVLKLIKSVATQPAGSDPAEREGGYKNYSQKHCIFTFLVSR
jgi:hypothetical protein